MPCMIRKFKVTTAAAAEPLTFADMKAHLRLDVNDEQGLIESMIVAGRKYVEMFTRCSLITRTYTGVLDAFPANHIGLPMAPAQSVTSIQYIDAAGSTQTLSTDVYDLDIASDEEALVHLKYDQTYPATRAIDNAVTIVWVAGHGDAASDVPEEALQAMRLLVGHWYMNRETVIVGTISSDLEFAVESLLWGLRVE